MFPKTHVWKTWSPVIGKGVGTFGGGALWKAIKSLGYMSLKELLGISLSSCSLSPSYTGFHEVSRFLTVLKYCAATGPKQEGWMITGWNFWNSEPKNFFLLIHCCSEVCCHSDGKLTLHIWKMAHTSLFIHVLVLFRIEICKEVFLLPPTEKVWVYSHSQCVGGWNLRFKNCIISLSYVYQSIIWSCLSWNESEWKIWGYY